jgi:hypothetical protein
MSTHIERAIEQIQVKQPTVEVDWTLHTLDDGNIISTQERVIKDVRQCIYFFRAYIFIVVWLSIGASACNADSHSRAILQPTGP